MVGVADVLDGAIETFWSLPGARYVVVTLILVVAWYGSRFLIRFLGRPVARRFQRPSLTKTVLGGIRAIVMVFAASVAASQLGFKPGDILLSVTVFSAVLGLVLAPIIGSVINGLFLLADQPYEIGDMIELVDRDTRGT
ncbi:mechanosensitive ion channel domain-containing protein [Halorussus caseinilyticus]|uniref:Mechanosensitive ion channel domain-containing protein n=1 Tax=Halorussus caseinilyticus TaxID=3034025 RepID=A0ABD5WHT6_9EURY